MCSVGRVVAELFGELDARGGVAERPSPTVKLPMAMAYLRVTVIDGAARAAQRGA